MNQQFVTNPPKAGDTFIFQGIKLIAVDSPDNKCADCVGRDNYECVALPACFGIAWKFAADQRIDNCSDEQKEGK